ncbi:hypothetical protein D9M71_225730 [compost metagenome]
MVGVDEFLVDRRGIGQQAQPAERIDPLVLGQHTLRDALARHAVEAVATGDVVTLDAVGLAVLLEGDVGLLALELMQLHVGGRVDDAGTAGRAGIHQVTGDLGLAVDHHALAIGEFGEMHRHPLAIENQFDTFMHQAFGIHAFADAGLAEHVDSALLQHAGADAAEHVIGGLALDDDVVDTGLVQQLAKQQSGRTGTNDGNLGFHCFCLAKGA